MKFGYPPKRLPTEDELQLLKNLLVTAGEQIIVMQKPGSTVIAPSAQPSAPSKTRSLPAPVPPAPAARPPVIPVDEGGPDCVELDMGVLVHRVSKIFVLDSIPLSLN